MVHKALLALALISTPAHAGPIVGVASVVDGDTIEIHGQRIRLNGIDAPESRQLCRDRGGDLYQCGQAAAMALDGFLAAHRPVSCVEVDRDRYRRVVAECTAGGIDIGEWMVSAGHAFDWPRYSAGRYAGAQEKAQAAGDGLWAGAFELPWEWRTNRRVRR